MQPSVNVCSSLVVSFCMKVAIGLELEGSLKGINTLTLFTLLFVQWIWLFLAHLNPAHCSFCIFFSDCCGSGRSRDVWQPNAVAKIHNIIRRHTQLLAVILYIIKISIYYLILHYLDIELQDSCRSSQNVLHSNILENTAKSCVPHRMIL